MSGSIEWTDVLCTNPDFGLPADPTGRHIMRKRETGLALGTRAVVTLLCENDPAALLHVHLRIPGHHDRLLAAIHPVQEQPS